jgi:trigger factor
LGLLLSDVGQKNNVQISQAEMQRLIMTEAQKYPGQQQEVVKYFQENTVAAAQLRAPLYEEKVVDFILSKITLTERTVSRADLEAAIQDEDTEASKEAGPAENAQKAQAKAPAKAKKAKAAEGTTTPEANQAASGDGEPSIDSSSGETPIDSSSGETPAKPKKKAPSKKSAAQ